MGFAWDVFVEGDYAYIADVGGGLQVIDISVPSAPIRTAGCRALIYAYSVSVSDGYAYLTDFEYGLYILKVGL